MYSVAPGAMSDTVSATPTPWVPPAQMSHGEPLARQKVPAGRPAMSPLTFAACHAASWKPSMIPTLIPAPMNPAACHAPTPVLARTSCPRAPALARNPSALRGLPCASTWGLSTRCGNRMYKMSSVFSRGPIGRARRRPGPARAPARALGRRPASQPSGSPWVCGPRPPLECARPLPARPRVGRGGRPSRRSPHAGGAGRRVLLRGRLERRPGNLFGLLADVKVRRGHRLPG